MFSSDRIIAYFAEKCNSLRCMSVRRPCTVPFAVGSDGICHKNFVSDLIKMYFLLSIEAFCDIIAKEYYFL